MPLLKLGDDVIEYAVVGELVGARSCIVMLHEGLGSCSMWRDFPQQLARASGHAVLHYSRCGYGRSSRPAAPYALDYMHREALDTLPALLDALRIETPVLFGHSDGASIALIHAGAGWRAVAGLILLAPHVFVEPLTVASIAAARQAYLTGDLRQRLARHHADVDQAFRGWNDIWLTPEFLEWNITACLPHITCPILAIQGEDDEYGSMAQIEQIARQASAAPRVQLHPLAHCRHSPHKDQPQAVLDAACRFLAGLQKKDGVREHSRSAPACRESLFSVPDIP